MYDTSNVLEALRKEFPNVETDNHVTDLYVKSGGGVKEWLQANYIYAKNMTPFIDDIDGDEWLDIPFAYPLEHNLGI
jgi:hypothetical protein